MVARSLGGAAVDVCEACSGIWLARDGDLASLARAAQEQLALNDPARETVSAPEPRCPRCGRELGIGFVAGVGLLQCAPCRGLFVERYAIAILAAR